jgi:hypothetical protein
MHRAAHLHAIGVLRGVLVALREHLAELQAAVDIIAAERDTAQGELQRIVAHRPDYRCPVGLPLIASAEDLEAFYVRLLPAGGEEQVLADVHARLLELAEGTRVTDRGRFHEQIVSAVEATFGDRVRQLHVVDELRRRFPDPEQLGAVLQERVRESHEWIQLKDNSDRENGVFVIRLLGIDRKHAGDLPELLGRYDYQRGTGFQVVDIDDRDRIVFVQFRAVFPYSDWAHSAHADEAYERLSEHLPFEKFHVVPGERSLPLAGELLTDEAVRVLACKAWMLGRLRYDERDSTWFLLSSDETPLALGDTFDVLLGSEGYRRAVDIASHYACAYLARGPEWIIERLGHLRAVRTGKRSGATVAEHHVAVLVADDEVCDLVLRELDWWRKNSVPAAMQWGASRFPHRSAHRPRVLRDNPEVEQ